MCNLINAVTSIPFFGVSISIIIYWVLEYGLHRLAYKKAMIDKTKKRTLSFLWLIFSPGYAFAACFKGKEKGEKRKVFIELCNCYNFIVSVLLMSISLGLGLVIACQEDLKSLLPYILVINGYRFISRSIEIIWAFGRDVFDETPKSNLNKFQRLTLAIKSYFEIYVYSSSFYMMLIYYCSNDTQTLILKSILMSLSVGTLTNVAYSQDKANGLDSWLQLFPFIQVFATLSLVVLSLTMYVSRNSNSQIMTGKKNIRVPGSMKNQIIFTDNYNQPMREDELSLWLNSSTFPDDDNHSINQ